MLSNIFIYFYVLIFFKLGSIRYGLIDNDGSLVRRYNYCEYIERGFKTTVSYPIFTRKHLFWSHFLIKVQTFTPATLYKRDSNTGVFL